MQEVGWEPEVRRHRRVRVRPVRPLLQRDCQRHLRHGHAGVPVEQGVVPGRPGRLRVAVLPDRARAPAEHQTPLRPARGILAPGTPFSVVVTSHSIYTNET